MCDLDFGDDTLNCARDMLIIAVMGAGFRGEEFYNGDLTLEKRDGKHVLKIYMSKTQSANFNQFAISVDYLVEFAWHLDFEIVLNEYDKL